MATLPKAPTTDFTSTTLNGSINASTTSVVVNDASTIQTPTYAVIDRQDANGNNTPNAREVIYISSKATNTLTVTRGVNNSTARSHNDGAKLEPILTVGLWADLYTALTTEHDSSLGHTVSVTSMPLTTPKVTTSINDANGNEVIKTPATTNAVNEVTITNAATGNDVAISATGGDTDISLNLVSKGAGTVKVNGSAIASTMTDAGAYVKPATDGDEIRAYHSDGTSYVELQNDGTDSKINSGTGHIVLTPASSKLVKTSVYLNANTSNSYQNNTVILVGWVRVSATAATSASSTVTFGLTFSSAPIIGGLAAGPSRDDASLAPTSNAKDDNKHIVSYFNTTTTTVDIVHSHGDGTNLTNGMELIASFSVFGVI